MFVSEKPLELVFTSEIALMENIDTKPSGLSRVGCTLSLQTVDDVACLDMSRLHHNTTSEVSLAAILSEVENSNQHPQRCKT